MVSAYFNDTETFLEKSVFYNIVEVQKPVYARQYLYIGVISLIVALILLFFLVIT